jgi:glycosyltransferase involved in cell wall biosynthesis
MVLLEAMALGLPVIASDIPGPREIVVDGRTGLLFEPGNAKALAEALERLAGDPDTRSEYGSRGRALLEAEGLTAERSANAHVELYREVLAKARTGA